MRNPKQSAAETLSPSDLGSSRQACNHGDQGGQRPGAGERSTGRVLASTVEDIAAAVVAMLRSTGIDAVKDEEKALASLPGSSVTPARRLVASAPTARWYTLAEVADLFQVSAPTVVKMVRDEGLPGMRVGKQWRFRRDDVDRWPEQTKGERRGRRRT